LLMPEHWARGRSARYGRCSAKALPWRSSASASAAAVRWWPVR
jgi:hypothetical protein